jgi:uncharacterized membrane protein
MPDTDEKGAAEYGREALAQFREAARYGARALAERKARRGGAGHGLVERVLPALGVGGDEGGDSDADGGEDDHLFDASAPLPIQESIDVAVPVAAVFDLCTHFEELPRFSERIEEVDVEDDTHLTVTLKLAGRAQELPIEIVGEEPEERLDWEGLDGVPHSGVVTFHPLAPRLTRLELTIEQDSEGLRERLMRRIGVPERTVRQELRRFKAYAELWDEANEYRSADFKDPASEEEPDSEEEEDEDVDSEEEEPDSAEEPDADEEDADSE